MDEEAKRTDPLPEPRRWRPEKRKVSWDCMDCIVIEEQENLEIEGDDCPDNYWRDGWIVGICDMHRSDFDVDDNGRYHRVYPTRYWVSQFKFSRSMRRVLTRNQDLEVVTRPLRITPEKENLYRLHHWQRFGREPEALLNMRYKYQFSHQAHLMETCFFLDDKLIAFSIFEVGDYSIWSNLGAWSPEHASRSLGTLTILKEVEFARSLGHIFYYMGHYWPGNPDYEYKTRFPSLELYDWDDKCWRGWGHPITNAMLTERLRRHSDDE